MGQSIELIVGLGNPDPEYLNTRHNAGFWFVDALALSQGEQFKSDKKLLGDTAEVRVAGQRVRILKPMTHMNLSGQSVGAATRYYKIAPENVLVVYDELDLPPGTVRLKFAGGHAGHNGVRSVVEHIGSQFWRLRLGVGHPGSKERVVGHVLRPAHADEENAIIETIRRGLDALPVLIERGEGRAMTLLHTRKPDSDDTSASDEKE
jgi:PTH1 family peptidyl-tRNA hydrolase